MFVDGYYGNGIHRIAPIWNVIMDVMLQHTERLHICVFVYLYVIVMVSWSGNVHLLNGHVYVMLLLHEHPSASNT